MPFDAENLQCREMNVSCLFKLPLVSLYYVRKMYLIKLGSIYLSRCWFLWVYLSSDMLKCSDLFCAQLFRVAGCASAGGSVVVNGRMPWLNSGQFKAPCCVSSCLLFCATVCSPVSATALCTLNWPCRVTS